MGTEGLSRARPEIARWLEGFLDGDWRVMLSWLTTGCAALWLYCGLFATGSRDPIGWFASMAGDFGLSAPGWMVELPEWLGSGERQWLPAALAISAAAAVTVLARPGGNSGLAVLTTISLGVLVSVERSLAPLLWVIALAAIPLLLAVGMHAKQAMWGVDEGSSWYLWDVAVLRLFLGLSVMWLPLVLPVLAVVELVRSYALSERDDAIADLRAVVQRIDSAHREGLDPNPVDLAMLESCLSRSDELQHHRARATIRFLLESPRGARSVRVGR